MDKNKSGFKWFAKRNLDIYVKNGFEWRIGFLDLVMDVGLKMDIVNGFTNW